jgi:hypothetical protein
MRFLIDQVILVAQIDEEAFKELSDNAYEALERKHKLRDDPLVSLKEEYLMDIPYKFEDWLAKTIDRTFLLHKEKRGVYGADHTNLKMNAQGRSTLPSSTREFFLLFLCICKDYRQRCTIHVHP